MANTDKKRCKCCGKTFKGRRETLYCSCACFGRYQYEQRIYQWLSGELVSEKEQLPLYIRRYLFEKHNSSCSLCGWSKENPVTKLVPLTVNHIDGDATNNKPDNVELICPNCHSLTPTYGSLNNGKGRINRVGSRKHK